MPEKGLYAVFSSWSWWCHLADGVPLWNPFGALLSVFLMLALIGRGIKYIRGDD